MKWTVFGEDWGSHPSSTQHLFRYLSANEQVVWMNSMGLRHPKLNAHDIKRLYTKGKKMMTRNASKHASCYCEPPLLQSVPVTPPESRPQTVLSPMALPFYGFPPARKVNKYCLSRQIKKAQASMQKSPHALWLSLPSAVDVIGHCDEEVSVYYCGDDFRALAGVDHKIIGRMEDELVEKCDLILTASEMLADRFPAHKTRLLEHGVDYRQFAQKRSKPTGVPHTKTLGFYGQLADWVDIELLEKIADHYPSWTLMLIGAVHTNTKELLNKPNVKILPPMPHSQLSAFVQNWDIALLPFRHCQQIDHCNPLKLREYLASGTPIVCTDFHAARAYQSAITLVSEHDDYISKLDHIVRELGQCSNQEKQTQRALQSNLVKQDDWSQKAKLAHHYVLCALNEKQGITPPKTFNSKREVCIELR
ncbi:glycosyltransferase [Marinomonas balearica]|uniref:Glycosyltransferase involved in cell wall biosynthesis n=1 Tax=Marinomonas balearica TaxID=491947 RepID=A0A4R6MGM6_9GAMM|nr:glycosyltransferase [Marinomonas balearica]TDP01068.1 glycosyltransferase involved in cell wall biosynthesis [Marinomonas balearica]